MGRLVQRLQISAVINCIYTAIMTGTCTRDTLQKTNAMNTKRSCFIDMHHLLHSACGHLTYAMESWITGVAVCRFLMLLAIKLKKRRRYSSELANTACGYCGSNKENLDATSKLLSHARSLKLYGCRILANFQFSSSLT